jgi:hypothetical protein
MSKIKTVKTGIDFIKQWVIKTALKQQPKGVLTTLPKKDFVDLNTAITAERLMRNGVDPNAIKNVDQVENIINQLNKPRVVAADSPEGKGITEALLGKKGEVFNLQGEKLDPSKPIVGGSQSGKKINREFFERNAEAKELQKRIESGVASTVERILAMEPIDAMKEANKVIGRKGQYKNLSQEDAKKILQDTEDHIFERNVDIDPEDMFADGGRIGFKGGADMATVAGDTTPARKGSVNVSSSGNVTFNPGGKDDPVDDRSSFEQTINQRNIVGKSKKPKESFFKNLYNVGQDFNYLRNLAIGNFPGIGKQLLFDLGRRKFLDNQVMLDEEGIINGLPENQFAELTDMQKKMLEGPQKNLKDIMGISNEEILKNIEKFNDPNAPATIEDIEQFYQQAKDGGRIGLKDGMDRRTFMKVMAGLASIPVVGKLFKGAKVASKAATKVPFESATRSEAPAYFLDLVTKIKSFGKKSKVGPSDRVDEYSYTGKNGDEYTLTEDITTGDAQITKDKIGGTSYEEGSYDVIEDRTVMEFRAGRMDVKDEGLETQKGFKEADEYEEYKVEFDQDGTEAGAEAMDEYIQKEIIEEAAEEAPSIKKASGGIARMLGE